MTDIEFHFDFGSPNAYLAHRAIPAVEARSGLRVRYVPVLLGGVFKATNNRSPMEAFADIPAKRAYMVKEMERFVARHGITEFRRNPHFPVNTLAIMRGAWAAQEAGCFMPYVNAMFRGMWEEARKLDDPAVIAETLAAAGLGAAGLMALAQTPAVKGALLAATESSVARGCFGSPTFFVGEEMFFGKDQLRDAEEEALRRRAA
ncbi:MAG: 2-hydroxychromene-2-carboxylate isomerase [Acetobacteraceae bacterium]|nr:2-hydroxychromene-2-carboxylate isomerase [Acetobacteraceae bacterium]